MQQAARPRILQRTAAAADQSRVAWQPLGADGEPGDPGGTVTVGVTNAGGSTVIAAGTATDGDAAEMRRVAHTLAQTTSLDRWTATWKIGATTVAATEYDVVGGFMFSVADMRAGQPSMSSGGKYELGRMLEVRDDVEAFVEDVTNVAFTPRFAVVDTLGGGTRKLITGRYFLRSVRWVRTYDKTLASEYTEMSATDLAELRVNDAGLIERPSFWEDGMRVVAGVEHGLTTCPVDVKTQAIRYARTVANRTKDATPERSASLHRGTVEQLQLRAAGTEFTPTGIEEFDEVLRRWARRRQLIATPAR